MNSVKNLVWALTVSRIVQVTMSLCAGMFLKWALQSHIIASGTRANGSISTLEKTWIQILVRNIPSNLERKKNLMELPRPSSLPLCVWTRNLKAACLAVSEPPGTRKFESTNYGRANVQRDSRERTHRLTLYNLSKTWTTIIWLSELPAHE